MSQGPKIKIDADLSSAEQALASFRNELAELKKEMSSAPGNNRMEGEFQAAGNALNKLMQKYDQLQQKLNGIEKSGKRYADILKEVAKLTQEAAKLSLKVEEAGSLKGRKSSYFSDEAFEYRSEQRSLIDHVRRDASMARDESRRDANRSKVFGQAVSLAGFAGGAALGGGGGMSLVGSKLGEMLKYVPGAGPMLGAFGSAIGGKIGGMADNSYSPAKQEAILYSDLRKSLGSTKFDFEQLRSSVRSATDGIGVAHNEAAQLATQFAKTSNASGDTADLAKSLSTSTGFSRGYGINPSSGAGFFANMRLSGVTSNDASNRRLAVLIGESVARSGTSAKMDEVLGALSSFASGASRTLLKGNVEGYLSSLTSLTGSNIAGLKGSPNTAAALLDQANSAYMSGGAMGEASKSFMLQAFVNSGSGMDAIDAKMMQEAGMFSPMSSVFGNGSPMYQRALKDKNTSLAGHYDSLSGSSSTGLDMIMAEMTRRHGNDTQSKALSLSGMFGTNLNQSAALMGMVDSMGVGGLEGKLKKYGVNLDGMDMSKLSASASILSSGGPDEFIRKQLADLNKTQSDQGKEIRDATVGMENSLQDLTTRLIPIESESKGFLAEILRRFNPDSKSLSAYDAANPSADSGESPSNGSFLGNVMSSISKHKRKGAKMVAQSNLQRDISGKIFDEAMRQGVPPQHALALAMNESSLGANMQGPMIKKGMHKGDRAAGPFHYMAKSSKGWNRNNIDENIAHGVSDLKKNYDKFGSWDLAAAAHFTGAGRPEYLRGELPNLNDGGASVREYVDRFRSNSEKFNEKLPASAKNKQPGMSAQVNGTFILNDQRGRQVADPVKVSTSFQSAIPAGS